VLSSVKGCCLKDAKPVLPKGQAIFTRWRSSEELVPAMMTPRHERHEVISCKDSDPEVFNSYE
jgi:hypothetical protein